MIEYDIMKNQPNVQHELCECGCGERIKTGPKSVYRHKIRQPISITLTGKGQELLAEHTGRTGMRRSDFMETLLRDYGKIVEKPKAAIA